MYSETAITADALTIPIHPSMDTKEVTTARMHMTIQNPSDTSLLLIS
jgi:hypothetical protein